MILRCPQCKLNQFLTKNGKCRRCSTELNPIVDKPARKPRWHPEQYIYFAVKITRKQAGLIRDRAALSGLTRNEFVAHSLVEISSRPIVVGDGLFWGVQWRQGDRRSRIHIVAVDRWRTICGHEFKTDGRLQLPLLADRAGHLCKVCEMTYKRLVGEGWWGNVVLRPASSYTPIMSESLTADV